MHTDFTQFLVRVTKSLVNIATLYLENRDTHQAIVFYEKLLQLEAELVDEAGSDRELPDFWTNFSKPRQNFQEFRSTYQCYGMILILFVRPVRNALTNLCIS
jgi:hypothetical protein